MHKKSGVSIYTLLVASFVLAFASSAFAATYECSPQQAFIWKHGTFQSVPKRKLKETLRFDDEAGVLWLAATPSVPASPMQFDILQKIDPHNDLIAVSKSIINGHFNGTQTLYIRSWDKTAGLIYSFAYDQGISTGRCVLSSAKESSGDSESK